MEGTNMEKGKKADQEKNAGKTTKDAAQEPEKAEDGQEVQREREAAEQTEETAKEQDIFDSLPNPCVYCGPTVRGVARQYTTYHGGITDALRDFIKAHPHVLGLIVSTGAFPSMRKRLETRGTLEANLYKAVKAEL